MSQKENMTLKLVKSGNYVSTVHSTVDLELFQKIHKTLQIYPELGECSFISGKLYFTAKGAKRIAHKQKMKGVKFEYIDPEEFAKKIPWLRKEKIKNKIPTGKYFWEQMIIVKAFVQNKYDGWVQGMGIVDTEVELAKRKNRKTGEKSHWTLKDLCYFTETKAITRAISNAYSIEIYEDLPDKMRKQAIDVRQKIEEKYPNAIPVEATEEEITSNIENFDMNSKKKEPVKKEPKKRKKKTSKKKVIKNLKEQIPVTKEGMLDKEIANDLEEIVIEEHNEKQKLKNKLKTDKQIKAEMKDLEKKQVDVKEIKKEKKKEKDHKKIAMEWFESDLELNEEKSVKTLLGATDFFDNVSLKKEKKVQKIEEKQAEKEKEKPKKAKTKKKKITKKKVIEEENNNMTFVNLQEKGEKEYDYCSLKKGEPIDDIPYMNYLKLIKAGIKKFEVKDPDFPDMLVINLKEKTGYETFHSILKETYFNSITKKRLPDIEQYFKKIMKKEIDKILENAHKVSKGTPNEFMLKMGEIMEYSEGQTLWLATFLSGNKLVKFVKKGVVFNF